MMIDMWYGIGGGAFVHLLDYSVAFYRKRQTLGMRRHIPRNLLGGALIAMAFVAMAAPLAILLCDLGWFRE